MATSPQLAGDKSANHKTRLAQKPSLVTKHSGTSRLCIFLAMRPCLKRILSRLYQVQGSAWIHDAMQVAACVMPRAIPGRTSVAPGGMLTGASGTLWRSLAQQRRQHWDERFDDSLLLTVPSSCIRTYCVQVVVLSSPCPEKLGFPPATPCYMLSPCFMLGNKPT